MINPHQSILSLSPLSPTLPPSHQLDRRLLFGFPSISLQATLQPTIYLSFSCSFKYFPHKGLSKDNFLLSNCLALSLDLHPTIKSAVKTTHGCVSLCNVHSSLSSIQTSFHRYSKESSSSQHNLPIYLLWWWWWQCWKSIRFLISNIEWVHLESARPIRGAALIDLRRSTHNTKLYHTIQNQTKPCMKEYLKMQDQARPYLTLL